MGWVGCCVVRDWVGLGWVGVVSGGGAGCFSGVGEDRWKRSGVLGTYFIL